MLRKQKLKKRFRKLGVIHHHTDKNDGSKMSEETFKAILNTYETLSDKER
jgi:DnaJ-class molecular chaperone